jgi:small redox-active disulfide protein 2
MDIKILGAGCAKCRSLEKNVAKAVEEAGIEASIEKVKDLNDIMDYGVMVTPALVIDGDVKVAGKVLKPDEIKQLIL